MAQAPLNKEGNFPEWYSQLVVRSGLIEYYDISGCYILKPAAYAIWENIQQYMDKRIKEMGVNNVYFPCFVSKATLQKEEDQLHGFTPEVAWVTKSGQSDLQEPIAIRPTSETIIYPAFKNWISSHRDMPLKVNQWCNVVRWEFSHPYPFIRTREFLWQEGHTAFSNQKEAEEECRNILELYANTYKEMLAIPVIRGKKSKGETFPGAYYSLTVEALIPTNGRSVQAGTSHHLGQTFSKMFDISFEDDDHKKKLAWQNSWGLSTRSIGVCIMLHGDNKGLKLPPKVALKQIMIIPIHRKGVDVKTLDDKAFEIRDLLKKEGFRAFVDNSDVHNPGWKYNQYEMEGVPLRIELGPKDYQNKTVMVCRRDTGKKELINWDVLVEKVKELLEDIHNNMYEEAKKAQEKKMRRANTWEEFLDALDSRSIALCPWCEDIECEKCIKTRSAADSIKRAAAAGENTTDADDETQPILTGSAKALCIPIEQPELAAETVCFQCGKKATTYAWFGRSY